ncbi:MAG: hypothetical protein FJY99_12525 [Candidatus Sericytochromatia bacterium]|nr:hypothetical protein [Candidatus Tanganyikabacteria bacterium]
MTLLIGIGPSGVRTLGMLDDLLAMAVAPDKRPKPRIVAVVASERPSGFPGPVQLLDADPPAAWSRAPWLACVPGERTLVHALQQAETDWKRILSADRGAIHLVLSGRDPEATLLATLAGWAKPTERPLAVTWVDGVGPGGRATPDETSAACILLRDLLTEPESPLPRGTWTGQVNGHDRERVQAILEARLLEQLLDPLRPAQDELLATWRVLDPKPELPVDPGLVAATMVSEGPIRGETLRAWLQAELDMMESAREPAWTPDSALVEEARDALRIALREDLWPAGPQRPTLGAVDCWLDLLDVVQTGITRRKEAVDRQLESWLVSAPAAEAASADRLNGLHHRPRRFLGSAALTTDEVLLAVEDLKPWWRLLEQWRTWRTRRFQLEEQGAMIDRMARSLQAWRAMVGREGLRRLRQLGPIIDREAMPALAEEHEDAVREALAMLEKGPDDPLLQAAGGQGWVDNLIGHRAMAVVPQVADLMGALTARAVRATAMAATAPAGSKPLANRSTRAYDPTLHPFTGHGGRTLRPGWLLGWSGQADSAPPGPSPEDAVAVLATLASGGIRWAAGAFRILREDSRWEAIAPGQHPLDLPGRIVQEATWLPRVRALAAEGLCIPADAETRRRHARQYARLLRTLQAPDAPDAWAGALWARLEREGWPPLVLAESENSRRTCAACGDPCEEGSCPSCGTLHGTWWAAV